MSKKEVTKRLKSDLKQVVAQLERFNDFIRACDQYTNKMTINERLVRCEILWDDFNKLQSELEFLEESTAPKDREEFENKYFETICLFKELLSGNTSNNSGTNQSTNNLSMVKLPPLDLPSFDGKYENWTSFFDTFIALIHSSNSLTNVQKFYYLQSCLKGEAAQTICSVQATDSNYEIAFNMLRERYENKRLIVQSHLKSLFDMPVVGKNSHAELRQFLDTIQKNVRALKGLKEPVEHWDTMLVYLLTSKLDIINKREWESFSIKNNTVKFDDFIRLLTERCQVLESVQSGTKIGERAQENKSQKYSFSRSSKSFLLNKEREQCLICHNGEHWFSSCSKFLGFSEGQRINEIKKLRLCLNCLKPNHLSSNCKFGGCKKCGKPHHDLLHINFSKVNKTESSRMESSTQNKASTSNFVEKDNFSGYTSRSDSNKNDSVTKAQSEDLLTVNASVNAHSANSTSESEVLLSTAKVCVVDKNGKPYDVRALLDCGSQSNFISSDLVARLNLSTNEVRMSVVGVNSSVTKTNKMVELTIQSKFCPFSVNLQFFVLNKIASHLPLCHINKESLKLPINIFLADPDFNVPGPIDLLLGANIFYELLCSGQIRTEEYMPIMQKTRLGWVISGNVPSNEAVKKSASKNNKINCMQTVCTLSSNRAIQKEMEKFWSIEEIQSSKVLKQEEQDCEDLFVQTTKHASDGRFTVELPTREGIHKLGESKEMAIKRFNKLERKLTMNETLKEDYSKFMTEYEKLGHMSRIPEREIETNNLTYYMPHHPVVKETSTTTKLRVVFDASAVTSRGISLNEKLKCGPVIQDELYSILIRFREHNVVIGADIEKMYRQVWIKQDQRDLQRVVWRNSPKDELRHYRLNTVTYGTTPASFLAIRSLHMAAEENQLEFPSASREIKRNFYVDDLLTGTSSVERAITLKKEISEVLSKSGFILRKWVSNKREVLDNVDDNSEIKHYLVEEAMTKTLGIAWNTQEDSLQYTVKIKGNLRATKRNILSIICRIFDPLGLIGPVMIRAKMLMQKLWVENLDWDDQVSRELCDAWVQFYEELPTLINLNISRQVLCENPRVIELHGFCDSSERAYGTCIYVRSVNSDGAINSHLLCAKSKVAPMKTLTLPRLELCGALLLSRIMNKTIEALNVNVDKIHYWTDSKIVLAWLSVEAANWSVFVSHRVSEIQQKTNIEKWKHVSGEENPADLISRGCSPNKLIASTLWWNGPWWLDKNMEIWPSCKSSEIENVEVPEKRNVKNVFVSVKLDQDIFVKFSTLMRLQRVIAYCLRFYKNISSNINNKLSDNLSVSELEQSLLCLVKISQNFSFSDEISALELGKILPRNSKLISLNPFLDENKILRVGGRLGKAQISFDSKFPMILDKAHSLSKLIIMHYHKCNLHVGPQNLLSFIRGKFWILGGINTIKKILRSCIICFRVKPKKCNTIMGELPEQRIIPTKPFFNSGVDYAGPFFIRSSKVRNAKILKAYLCLFVCFVTKAVHLEVVSDLTTQSFMNALKRFISRRGRCQNIFSDCGTNFVGASREMSTFFKLINDPRFKNEITDYLARDGIRWHFIPPRSPHFGGLWESHIKIAKTFLKKVVGNAALTFEELTTVFVQIEAVINSRPLSPLSSDPSDLSPLTPGHFLVGDSLIALPETDVRNVKMTRLNRYQYLRQIVQHFWDRWSREYLSAVNKRSKWLSQEPNLKVGDLVVLRDDNLPPLKWSLGRVEKVYPGSDDVVRVLSIKTSNGLVKRAVTKVCVLPVAE